MKYQNVPQDPPVIDLNPQIKNTSSFYTGNMIFEVNHMRLTFGRCSATPQTRMAPSAEVPNTKLPDESKSTDIIPLLLPNS